MQTDTVAVSPPRSAYANTLHAQLEYQQRVAAVLLLTTRPFNRASTAPMFSRAELDEMDRTLAMGLSPEGFAARLAARNRAGRTA